MQRDVTVLLDVVQAAHLGLLKRADTLYRKGAYSFRNVNRFARDRSIQYVRVQVSAVGPANCANVCIHRDLAKVGPILEWCKDARKLDEFGYVYKTLYAVFKA